MGVRTNLETGEQVAHVIECNPRVHSQMSVFATANEQIDLGRAMLPASISTPQEVPLQPSHGRRTFWFWNELLKCVPNNFVTRYRSDASWIQCILDVCALPQRLCTEDDGDFVVDDPAPFIMRNHFQPVVLLTHTLRAGRQWKKIDFNIGKVVEVNGD